MKRFLLAAALAAVLLGAALGGTPASAARAADKPTIVLVHGAFADASGYGAVISRLQRRGYPVIAPANPLRGPASDAAYVASVMRTIDGPIVLVAHSYGGAVISVAANLVPNVKALVYLDALALEEGESNFDIAERFPSKILPALRPRPFPQADGTEGTDFYIDPASFRAVFAADLPARTCRADGRRPASHLAGGRSGEVHGAGLEDDPVLVPDRAARTRSSPPKRSGSWPSAPARTSPRSTSSHASYISRPGKVTKVILRARATTAAARPPRAPPVRRPGWRTGGLRGAPCAS